MVLVTLVIICLRASFILYAVTSRYKTLLDKNNMGRLRMYCIREQFDDKSKKEKDIDDNNDKNV
jgi:hypothetical protein